MVYQIGAFLLLLLVFVHLNRCCANVLQTGAVPSNQLSRISYGSNASTLAHPYMVNIWRRYPQNYLNEAVKYGYEWINTDSNQALLESLLENTEELGAFFICGGTLISSTCILTAAHCVFDEENHRPYPNEVFKFYGANNTLGKGVLLPEVESVFVEDYDAETFDMDVAIIKLTEPVKDCKMKTIDIDYSEVNDDDPITIAGWGLTEAMQYPEYLKETNGTIMNTGECQKNRLKKITDNMLCGRTLRKSNSCDGDSGGPMIRNGKQIGIVSFGPHPLYCGKTEISSVYAKLGSSRISEFLRKTIANNC